MRTAALLLSVVLALSASSVRAEEPAPTPSTTPSNTIVKQRGFLSGLGLGFLIGGLAGLGAGIGGLITANEAQAGLAAYGSMFTEDQRPSVLALQDRAFGGSLLAAVGLVGGGLALAGGIICLAVDTPSASVAFVPTSQGGAFVFSGRF